MLRYTSSDSPPRSAALILTIPGRQASTGRKLRALDLYCKAGGASRGLADAGYDVTGVDIEPQPNYPYTFVQGDALVQDPRWVASFDLVWASPPCQKFSAYRRKDPTTIGNEARNLIPATRKLLQASGRPWIMENVPGAPLKDPCTLCGSMFGLSVRRHRWFETSTPIAQSKCQHHLQQGSFPCAGNRTNPRKTVEIGVWRIPLETQREAMGIDWMNLEELSQAVPPAYASHLAHALTKANTP